MVTCPFIEPIHGLYLNQEHFQVEGIVVGIEPIHGLYLNSFLVRVSSPCSSN